MATHTPTQQEAQDAVNKLKDLLMNSELRIVWPVKPDNEMRFTLTHKVSAEDFDRILKIIELARDSCVESPALTAAIAKAEQRTEEREG